MPDWWNGRRRGLKIPGSEDREGSSPSSGTNSESDEELPMSDFKKLARDQFEAEQASSFRLKEETDRKRLKLASDFLHKLLGIRVEESALIPSTAWYGKTAAGRYWAFETTVDGIWLQVIGSTEPDYGTYTCVYADKFRNLTNPKAIQKLADLARYGIV